MSVEDVMINENRISGIVVIWAAIEIANLHVDPVSISAKYVLEATGHPQAVLQGLHMIKKLGTFVEFSLLKEPVTADWTIIGDQKELNVYGAHLSPFTFPTSIDLIGRNLVDVDRIVTHVMPLGEFGEAFHKVAEARDSIKVLLDPVMNPQ